MNEIVTIGLDLAKNIFQVHGIDACGKVVVRTPSAINDPCTINAQFIKTAQKPSLRE
ncbi:hypothetical protein [Rhizobium rhizogenes]|uniref:hypothetical protein n=1 Tax=Rhizobium rhizogenes TaxID=359 RepID=UPI000B1F7403|nr:hypothetical protein [Rhizobium rhizogenes]NTF82946.1 hypothetical protein [Rhizobium rhizogenes]NTI72474.1 hypothetical protein [Rhizobium rhizogenes]